MINEQRLLDIFFDMIRIYSPSKNERGLADYIIGFARARGYSVREDDAGHKIGGDTGNIVISIPGTTPGPSILYSAHMDTVEPAEDVEPITVNGVVLSKNSTILGADDKAGCAAMLELLAVASEKDFKSGPIHLVFTVAEEIGLLGAKHLDMHGEHIDYVYVLDAHGKVGTIIMAAPYQDSFEATFVGKSAHAGVEPENGINAIQAAAKAVSKMQLGRIDHETTANIGIINGGRAGNIVPDEVTVHGECRSLDIDKLQRQAEHMLECFNSAAEEVGTNIIIEQTRPYNGYMVTEESPIVKAMVDCLMRMSLPVVMTTTGGGSDANVFAEKGMSTVDIGVGFEDVHTEKESMPIQELMNLGRFLVNLVEVG